MIYYRKYKVKKVIIMWKKFLKKSGWTDIIISLIFILFGIMLIARPDAVMSAIAIILGGIFIAVGVLKVIDYFASENKDSYLLAISVVLIIVGVVVMFASEFILAAFRVLIAIWIIYSGIMNLQTTIIWKDYKSKLWLTSIILALITLIAGIYILVNQGAILQVIGFIITLYGVLNVFENIIFIKKVEDYLE